MKQIIILFIGLLTLPGCNTESNNSAKWVDPLMTPTTVPGQKFFNFDQIDHYFNDFNDTLTEALWNNRSKSELDSLKEGLITGEIPNDMENLSFIDKLEQIGFEKKSLDKSKFADINDIFSVKPVDEVFFTSCIYIYRDVFILKKNGKIIGVAKVCFQCLGYKIVGTTSNTKYFGQNGDFEKLKRLIRK